MRRKLIILAAVLLFFTAGASGMEGLPEHIHLKNNRQGLSYEYYYALYNGRIWIKPNEINTGNKGDWQLFNSTGLPYGDDAPSFHREDRITAFSTEGTMIAAVSITGRFYLWQPTLKKNTTWTDKTGAPFENTLFLPRNRGWCFSFSTMNAPWKRLTPMHPRDIVIYWEDIDGNRTQFGLTATIYVVDPDGQKIRYTDTGLPTSWHKAFTSPERGRFIIEKMSASASAIFVINKTGKMYTRMMDYEMEGGCPGLRFTYMRGKRTKHDEIAPLMTSVRTLPLPDWREQEAIEEIVRGQKKGIKTKKARDVITKNITILLTGEGNAARELRVQGRKNGKYGYFYKKIFDNKWDFKVTGEKFSEDEIVINYLQEAPQGIKLDKTYMGEIKQYETPLLRVELVDFYYYNTPATLRVHVNGKKLDMKFHTVDLWSMTAQRKQFPELVGNPSGEPKMLQGTLEIPEQLLFSRKPDIKNTVDRYLRRFHLVPFAFKIAADDGRVMIESKLAQRVSNTYMDYAIRERIEMDLSNVSNSTGIVKDQFFTAIARMPVLDVQGAWLSYTKKEIPLIKKLISLNKKALAIIEKLNRKFQEDHFKTGSLHAIGSVTYYLFDGVINLVGLPSWMVSAGDPGLHESITELGGVSYTGGAPFNEYARMNLMLAARDPEDCRRAVEIIEQRIKFLVMLIEFLEKKPPED
jgi:hypothetical protein